MIASLGMYDFGPALAANDRFWGMIRDALRDAGQAAPDSLTRGDGAYWDAWTAPDLVLSQTCGYPYRARLHDRVAYVATPDYGVKGAEAGFYRSVLITRRADPRQTLKDFDGARLAYNEALSQSGWAAPQAEAARSGIQFGPAVQTGGHRLSAKAVATDRADLAAIDAVTWSLMDGVDPVVDDLRVIGLTEPTPGLPLITAPGRDADRLFVAVSEALAALSAEDRAILRLKGLVRIPTARYLAVPNPPPP